MSEIETALAILPCVVAVALVVALTRRLDAAGDGGSPFEVPGLRREEPWPRGVQEEEPVRWTWRACDPREQGLTPGCSRPSINAR